MQTSLVGKRLRLKIDNEPLTPLEDILAVAYDSSSEESAMFVFLTKSDGGRLNLRILDRDTVDKIEIL